MPDTLDCLDPLVRGHLMIEIKKIIEKGPGKKATPEMQASSFDRQWFDSQATILKDQLDLVSVTFVRLCPCTETIQIFAYF